MKAQDNMTSDVQCCGPETNLADAAKMMGTATAEPFLS